MPRAFNYLLALSAVAIGPSGFELWQSMGTRLGHKSYLRARPTVGLFAYDERFSHWPVHPITFE